MRCRVREASGLDLSKDFFVGYSPERINPGDKFRKIRDIVKVTSGSTPEVGAFVNEIYSTIVPAGTPGVINKVAEASKVIENIQGDVNIGVKQLHQIFSRLRIITRSHKCVSNQVEFYEVVSGFVGGHCISVDPYYLLHKSQEFGCHI